MVLNVQAGGRGEGEALAFGGADGGGPERIRGVRFCGDHALAVISAASMEIRRRRFAGM